jgi:transposase-like protein
MTKRRVKRSAAMWRELFRRQTSSGLVTAEFCRREGINAGLFRRWRAALAEPKRGRGGASRTRGRPEAVTPSTTSFIDLGGLGSAGTSRFDIRLELGGGIVLSIARG